SRRQLVEQGLGLLQVERVEAFGEPAVDGGEEITGFGVLASVAPEARKACRSTKLKQACSLPAADFNCASKKGFPLVMLSACHEEPTPEAVPFGLPPTLTTHLC